MLETRSLLKQVIKLEEDLHSFAFEQLNTKAAKQLRTAFDRFKQELDQKVFGEEAPQPIQAPKSPRKNTKPKTEKEEYGIIANVSHEIRTPLHGIIGFLDLLKETKMTKYQWELVHALDTASDNLLDRTNALLDYSKIASGNETFAHVNFNLQNLVDEVAFLCRTLITNEKVQFHCHIEDTVPTQVKGDPSKLSQILLNLLGNSIKFVEKGFIELHISLKETKDNLCFLECKITDSGIGIPNNKLKHIFETYQQAEQDTHLRYGGSGLGLSIVKELVQKMGGTIGVTSEVGVGSCFDVILPFSIEDNIKKETVKSPKTNVTPRSYTGLMGKRILVFEDNVLNQRLMHNRLSSWGCDVFVTADGKYGLELLQKQTFDLILMDLKMPKMNGFEITQKIRLHHKQHIKQLPIIAISADFSVQDKEQCDSYEINDFILKPYDADKLYQVLTKHTTGKTSKNHATPKPNIKDHRHSGVDLTPIYEECLGEHDLMEELIRLFKQNILEFIGKSKTHLQTNNLQGIGFAAHKIKSSLAMLNAKVLHGICAALHESCRKGDAERAQELYNEFLEAYPPVEVAIVSQLERLKRN